MFNYAQHLMSSISLLIKKNINIYDTNSIFGYTGAKFVNFNHVFYDVNNFLCGTPINRLLFPSKPGHSFYVYSYS